MAEEAAVVKTKRPTAQKRDITNEKRHQINKAFKSRVATAMRDFQKSLSTGDSKLSAASLSTVYSLLDRGVKRGIFKKNKASRLKSRANKRTSAFSS